ncbi:copia-type polyprotein, partial [Trifolium medium]|nr:copia-type polyprotein [Trifolium medium]
SKWHKEEQEEHTELEIQGAVNQESSRESDLETDSEDSEHRESTQQNEITGDHLEERSRAPPSWLKDYVRIAEVEEFHSFAVTTQCNDPETFYEAVKHSKWRKAMNVALDAIERNGTWKLTTLPEGAKVMATYSQQHGIDFSEVFASVARWDTIRNIIARTALKGWCLYQLDVKSAFLHREITEAVYIEQPPGFVKKGDEDKVYKLYKALYGLKQPHELGIAKLRSTL